MIMDNKLVVTNGEKRGRRGSIEGGKGSKRYKQLGIKYITRIYCTTQGIEPIFYNNFQWSIAFKNNESLQCTPVTYSVENNYTSIKIFLSKTGVTKIAGKDKINNQLCTAEKPIWELINGNKICQENNVIFAHIPFVTYLAPLSLPI